MKMVLLPKITYKFQMLPIAFLTHYFQVLKYIIMKFIWHNKNPSISLAVLRQGKKPGGLAVADVKKYYYAVVLPRVVEWAREKSEKQWVKIENNMC